MTDCTAAPDGVQLLRLLGRRGRHARQCLPPSRPRALARPLPVRGAEHGPGLRLSGAPAVLAAVCGIALGLVMVPVAVLVSRKRRLALYCTTICPPGLVDCLAGKLSPWRLRVTENCTRCGRCPDRCRYGALSMERLKAGGPGFSCTLCRECELACPRGGLAPSLAGRGLPPKGGGTSAGRAGQAFVCLVSAMHAAFLFMAMV